VNSIVSRLDANAFTKLPMHTVCKRANVINVQLFGHFIAAVRNLFTVAGAEEIIRLAERFADFACNMRRRNPL
jgi:hypothetical protein